jgi:hypothetical protein
MGTQQKKKKRTEDTRSLTSEIKRTQDQDINKLALQPTFELGYSPVGVGTTSYVNVSTSLGPSQAGSGYPAQATGLTITPQAGSDTQLNLAWTATTVPAEFNHYNVYRGPNGFTVDSSFEISEPTTNSYQNTGLIPGTTYYYRVSITNDAGLEGPASSQASGTTTGTAPVTPSLWLKLNGNVNDSSPNGWNYGTSVLQSYTASGQFGQAATFSYPSTPNPFPDYIKVEDVSFLQMDTSNVGFSISMWIYQTDMSGLSNRRNLACKNDNISNQWALNITSTGRLQFQVKKGGIDYRREKTGFVANTWQHVVATFNAQTNTLEVYRNAVAGQTSTGSYQYRPNDGYFDLLIGYDNYVDPNNDYFQSFFKGYIDEFQYFKGVCLTQAQVTNLMNTNAT